MDSISLDELIKESQFYHEFQPIINLSKEKVFGFEALIRSHYFKNPEHLFNSAKKEGKLFDLDLASILKAIETFYHLYKDDHRYCLFVNVYPSTLKEPSFKQHVEDVIFSYNINPNQVVFELNEAEQTLYSEQLKNSISTLKNLGILFALDDFGKGQSTIRSLLEVDPDIVKIDRYFSKNIANSSKKKKIVKFIMDICERETKVIAEGIETEDDLQTLIKLGAHYGQGYFLGKPEAVEHVGNRY